MESGKAPVRRSALRSKETRDAILTAASKLFSKKGYHDVTMRQIAVEAACSHTAIYQYFASKEIPAVRALRAPSGKAAAFTGDGQGQPGHRAPGATFASRPELCQLWPGTPDTHARAGAG